MSSDHSIAQRSADTPFVIPADRKEDALFAMREAEIFEADQSNILEEALRSNGFQACAGADGSIASLIYLGIPGDDQFTPAAYLLETIAPYVDAGSYLEFDDEFERVWRWVFDGDFVREVDGALSFPEPHNQP